MKTKNKIMCLLVSAFIVSVVAFGISKHYKNIPSDVPSNILEFSQAQVREKSIVLFEPNCYHYECTPGYLKYFVDLGYNVDLFVRQDAADALCHFEEKDKLRYFIYKDLKEVETYSSYIKKQFKKYYKVFLQTSDPGSKDLYNSLGLLKNKGNSILVFHNANFVKDEYIGVERFFKQNRIVFLGDMANGLFVNPHYFGEFPIHNKNHKTRFFITSTAARDYTPLVEAAKGLKNSGLDFEVVVTGGNTFSEKDIPEEIKENFIFKHRVLFKDLYDEVQDSDYIMVLFNSERKEDNYFRTVQVTGSAQLAYGFAKPMIINKDFAKFYKLDSENSFLYDQQDLEKTMREAILLNQSDYAKMRQNLQNKADEISSISLENMKIACNNK